MVSEYVCRQMATIGVKGLTDINDRGKVELPEQRSRAQPETVREQPAFPRSLMSVNARVV